MQRLDPQDASSKSSRRIIVAGLEASGSTFMYQVCNHLGLNTIKIHGARPTNRTELTLFPFRDIRDVITSNAKRRRHQLWNDNKIEDALIAEIDRFIQGQFPQAISNSTKMRDVIMLRYESFFPGNEHILVQLIADQYILSISRSKIIDIVSRYSIDSNQVRSNKHNSFKEWDAETYIHGNHITNKGVSGGWKGVFTKRVEIYFKNVLGDLLVDLGYEKDLNWSFDK